MKAYSLPPLYRFTKQNENVRTIQLLGRSKLQKHCRSINAPVSPFQSKSVVNSTDRADTGDSKTSPPRHSSSKKEHLSSIVREISQARLISLRKNRSGQSMTLSISDNGNLCAGSSLWATRVMAADPTFLCLRSPTRCRVFRRFSVSGD